MDQGVSSAKDVKDRPLFSWVENDILAIHLDRPPSVNKLRDPKTRQALLAAVDKASGVILDLRVENEMSYWSSVVLGWLYPHLPVHEVHAPPERYLVHSGYRPQLGMSSGGYSSAFQTTLQEVFPAAPNGKGKRTVFLAGEQTMVYPQREYRLLALFRFWNVIHYFYPYKELLDQDWDTVLPRFVPQFAAAKDALEYSLAVGEMAACIQDSHTTVFGSKELNGYFGEATPPVRLRLIQGKPVVSSILDAEGVKGPGVEIGDVVLAIDSEPVEKRMARLGKYIASSNASSHALKVFSRLLNGPDGSTLKLTVGGRDDKPREVTLPRKTAYAALRPKPSGEVFKVLAENIGYCDLERLTVEDVDAMLERLKDTRAIIFDLRCYPQGTAWALAPRLNVKGAKYGASFQRMLVSGAFTTEEGESRFAFRQPLSTGDKWKYKGKTVTLIDERAISQSEHTGLFLEAACATTFVGSQTAGANGDVTTLTLPGGLFVGFTGHDVRHADGGQLQRVGLVPHIAIKPTIKGVREGKDEVLDRAIKFLQEGK
jgi:C-terminal processing protease CtpA/Prc